MHIAKKRKKNHNENECRWNVEIEESHPQRCIARVDFIFLFYFPPFLSFLDLLENFQWHMKFKVARFDHVI